VFIFRKNDVDAKRLAAGYGEDAKKAKREGREDDY
jgi:hypothetical protein